MTELFPYQTEGVAFLAARKRGLLFDVPGLGKTPQAIRALDEVLNPNDMAVIICPASLVTNWEREIARWSSGGWFATVISYDKLVRNGPPAGRIDAVVLDEAHYCKTLGAKRTKAALKLAHDAPVAWALTGTPSPNNPSELYTLLRVFAEPVVTNVNGKVTTFLAFMKRYCQTQPNPFGFYPKVIGGRNGPELKARLQPFMVRRTKAQVLKDLPPLVQSNLYVDVPDGDKGTIRRLERAIGAAATAAIMDGNLRVLDGEHVATLRRLTGAIKAGAVAKIVADELQDGMDKIVLFAHHRDVLDVLEMELTPYGLVRLDGRTTMPKRQEAVDAFQTNPNVRVFLGQITAAGTGLTLTAASNALFCEMSWVPSENEQAAQRIHRIGQKNSCLVRYAVLPSSLDERIVESLRRKMTAINAVFS